MKAGIKQQFMDRWRNYFPGAALPIAFYYTDNTGSNQPFRTKEGQHCFIMDLAPVHQGQTVCFDTKSIACFGGKRYLGFSQNLMPNFEYFLSCGIPGKLEGERYKKTPELVKELLINAPGFIAPAPNIVFKRWDALDENDQPEVVIFYAPPDVLSGLFTLANYDEPANEAVFCPMGAGCGTIVQYPLKECQSERPRAVLGMFDVSARPGIDPACLAFSVPMKKFERMVDNMDESFLITASWQKIKDRLAHKIPIACGLKGTLSMKWLASFALALASIVPVYAGNLTGTWKGKLETAMGPIASTITLQRADAQLTGSVKTDLYEAKIENLELKDGKISFVTNTDFGKLYYEGTATAEELKLQVTGQDGNPLPLNVRKQR